MRKDGQYAFISYSSKNQQMADSVRLLFLEKGIPCWMAPYDIPAGSKYAYVINDALERCGCLVLLLTNASQESQFVEREIERAITYRKPIVPMQLEMLQLNSGFKFYIGNSQIIAVPEIRADAPEFLKVLEGIRTFVGYEEPEKREEGQTYCPIASRAMQCKKISDRWTTDRVTFGSEYHCLIRVRDATQQRIQCDLYVKTILCKQGKRAYLTREEQQAYSQELEKKKAAINEEFATAQSLCRHRYVVSPLEILFHEWEENDAYGCDLLIRYEPLTSLQQLLDEGKTFAEDEIVTIGMEIAEALSAFHEKGSLYLDVSPDNICINRYSAYKLCGFRIPKGEGDQIQHFFKEPQTGYFFSAPEAQAFSADVRTDIYALGTVLRRLADNGKRLYDYRSGANNSSADIGRGLRRVIEKACAPEPRDRFASIEAFCVALKNVHTQEHRTPSVLQRDITECGAACLSMIFAYWGKKFSLDQMCAETNVSPDGCNAGDIMRTARRFGLDCHGYRKEPEQLRQLPMPCVIHWDFNHFIVLEDIQEDVVYLNDPASGHKETTMEELDKHFTGVVLTFQPTENW